MRLHSRGRRGRVAGWLVLALLGAGCSSDAVSPLKTNRAPDPGTIRGVVAVTSGTPVGGARLELTSARTDSVHTTTSGDDGAFGFTDVPAGGYSLRVLPPLGYAASASEVLPIALRPGAGVDVAVPLRAMTETEAVVASGTGDTLALASGLVVGVEADGLSAPVTVRLALEPSADFGELSLLGVPATLSISAGTPAPGARAAGTSAAEAPGSLTVTVWQRVPTCSGGGVEMAFRARPDGASPALVLYSEPRCTTFVDPRTGETGAAFATSSTVPAGGSATIGAFRKESSCAAGKSLYPFPGTTEAPDRTPLILIHGWQPTKLTCGGYTGWEPGAETFGALADALRSDPRYQLYVLRYPSFEPIANATAFLRQEVERRGWQNREIVLVGHSMGGLVGRGYLAAHGADQVRALVTLGTPHLGSPLADDGLARSAAIAACTPGGLRGGLVVALGESLFPRTDGYRDLSPSGAWISAIRNQRAGAEKVYTLAGDARGLSDRGLLAFPGCVLDLLSTGLPDSRDDGIVPVSSALPDWTTLQTVVSGSNHLDITGGGSISRVRAIVGQLSQCRSGTPPARPAGNAFPLAGTLARQPNDTIDVVLNPILIDGKPVRDLDLSNFTVIENDCLKPFRITTDEGNVGVDLVFVQDLSGSMANAISGVRNSVMAFADSLGRRGVNVRMGSVGFSGPGGIATHPAAGSCEAIGPVQNLASPRDFHTHVSGSWRATGGCDNPENALEAVEYAHRNMNWRAGAARVYILITDVSMHTATTSCNGAGACTDQTITSIVSLLGSTATLHAVAPASLATRTTNGGADPWELATQLGGARLTLPANGVVDLNALGVTDRIADVVRLSFHSTSMDRAHHRIRVRVTVDGKVAELSPGLVEYAVHPSLQRH